MPGFPARPIPDDPAVLDPDVRLHDADDGIDDEGADDDRVQLRRAGAAWTAPSRSGSPSHNPRPARRPGPGGPRARGSERLVSPRRTRSPVVGPNRASRSARERRVIGRRSWRPGPGLEIPPLPGAAAYRTSVTVFASPGAQRSELPAGRSSRKPAAAARSNSSRRFTRWNGKCDETRMTRRDVLRTSSRRRSRAAVGSGSASAASVIEPGRPARRRRRADRGARSGASRRRGEPRGGPRPRATRRPAGPRPGARRRDRRPPPPAKLSPVRAASNMASAIRAIASGALRSSPRSRWRRASSAALKTRRRSSSQAVRRIEPSRRSCCWGRGAVGVGDEHLSDGRSIADGIVAARFAPDRSCRSGSSSGLRRGGSAFGHAIPGRSMRRRPSRPQVGDPDVGRLGGTPERVPILWGCVVSTGSGGQ